MLWSSSRCQLKEGCCGSVSDRQQLRHPVCGAKIRRAAFKELVVLNQARATDWHWDAAGESSSSSRLIEFAATLAGSLPALPACPRREASPRSAHDHSAE